ncbi:MAG: acyl-CoA thioesterase domain-containing protein [Acidimicrobiales bacterium]
MTAGGQAPGEPTRHPVPYVVRARWGDRLLAESRAAVRVELPRAPGEPPAWPLLCLPLADVRLDLMVDEGRAGRSPVTGAEQWWNVPAAGPSGAGRDVLRAFVAPPPGLGWLAGLATFDDRRVAVEVVDGRDGDDDRDVTVKRFPTWGDATDLLAVLDVRPAGGGRYVGATRPSPGRPVVEGSQMLGQAIVAASRHAPSRRVVSAHMLFLRVADTTRPLELVLEELSAGRTFTALAVDVRQDGRRCARGELLLSEVAPDVVRHAAPAPAVPGPYGSEPFDMSVTGRDLRVVGGAYSDDPDAPVGPPVIDAWVRFRDVPGDQALHAALCAQFTGHMPIAAALRPYPGVGQAQAHRTLSTAVNAIAIAFHAEVRADRWMLYHHRSTFAGDGMTRADCRVHGEDGELLASFGVDAMVRRFAGHEGPVDASTAL